MTIVNNKASPDLHHADQGWLLFVQAYELASLSSNSRANHQHNEQDS
jgi:hypothetical protein